MNERKTIIIAIAAIAVIALVGAIVLGALVVLGLDAGDDLQPGVSSFLLALVAIGGTAGGVLAPSPLSKSSGASDVQEVTGPDGGPVRTLDEAGVTLVEVCIAVIAVIFVLWAFGEVPR